MSKKKWSSFFMGVFAMSLLAGCSGDELAGGGSNAGPGTSVSKESVYMNVAVQLPVGAGKRNNTTNTPSDGDYGTSVDGTEVGKDYENSVKKVLLVLADKNNGFIAYGAQEGQSEATNNGRISTTQKISKSTLSEYYGESGVLTTEQREIYVYAFCNPTSDLEEGIAAVKMGDKEWVNKVCTVNETPDMNANISIWGGADNSNGFLMSTASASKSKKTLPGSLDDWNSYTSVDKAFNLSGINNANSDKEVNNSGAIPVERAVARFDFKDGSEEGDNTYVVIKGKTNADDQNERVIMKIKLEKMALVNMSKHFYYLRRVSDDGFNTNATICGTEYDNNYIVDVYADEKSNGTITGNKQYDRYFNFCMGHVDGDAWGIDNIARSQWYTSTIDEVLQKTEDNDNEWNAGDNKGDYRIWRYVTENTIPGPVNNQLQGLSTSIIFRGKMVAGEGLDQDETLKQALDKVTGDPAEDAILYSYSNNLYVRWTEVREAALKAGSGDPLYKAAFGTPLNEPSKDVFSNDIESPDYLWNEWFNKNREDVGAQLWFKQAATKAKFTIYQSGKEGDQAGYYCYYFYKNRHNNNDNDGVMGPMEFAVVRNNVYKLAVTKIDRLGHPRNSDDDPDPVDPEDPDENGDAYLTLSVEVLPWVVRVNNIEF